ncbi:uroporphyrinogen-III C-methyltransferase [Xylella fastidiosa]|uniref:Uroporphyrin-III C-methyltransferase n=1 Tax=Xylella fastidiosa subsp. sandyi Ann-1 TaxID=155920 RepID=A0A060HAW1_XYLFS|nr:uroporphyrinogen-III C-methyltransferase [Xylella fastidiosa]AIC10077.1 uroporphyrin-III C-methyltransferase [Xylella fastidiosa subsp. sandyi Ann-1]UIX81956.1 uroporphyrinogen-III C-methyltransferase [Xylella fastidiosa subsp. sandyi]
MNETSPPTLRRIPWLWLLLLLTLTGLGMMSWYGWRYWQAQSNAAQQAKLEEQQHWQSLNQTLQILRSGQDFAYKRLRDLDDTNRVLRDEILGLSQRSALLEQTVARLSDPNRHGTQALRLDETETLLRLGQQLLTIASDVDGARRAYSLAASTLEGLDDPGYLNLRQTLMQERNALDTLGESPQKRVNAALERFDKALQQLPQNRNPKTTNIQPWWHKVLSPLVLITPSHSPVLLAESKRQSAQDALQIELSLVRAAVERNDPSSYVTALHRIDALMQRLWPDSAARRARHAELALLAKAELRPTLSELGTTLMQLQSIRQGSHHQ